MYISLEPIFFDLSLESLSFLTYLWSLDSFRIKPTTHDTLSKGSWNVVAWHIHQLGSFQHTSYHASSIVLCALHTWQSPIWNHFLKDSNLKAMQTFCPPSLCGDLEAVFEGFNKATHNPLHKENQYEFFTYSLSSMWNLVLDPYLLSWVSPNYIHRDMCAWKFILSG